MQECQEKYREIDMFCSWTGCPQVVSSLPQGQEPLRNEQIFHITSTGSTYRKVIEGDFT